MGVASRHNIHGPLRRENTKLAWDAGALGRTRRQRPRANGCEIRLSANERCDTRISSGTVADQKSQLIYY